MKNLSSHCLKAMLILSLGMAGGCGGDSSGNTSSSGASSTGVGSSGNASSEVSSSGTATSSASSSGTPSSGGSSGGTTASTKAPLQGLVSMGSEVGDPPTNAMEEINAHPGVYTAAVINVYWAQLEPSEGVFDDSAIDSALANIAAYNALYPSTPVVGKLRVRMGAGTPAWVMARTGGPITLATSNGNIQVGAYWTSAYATLWQGLQQHLAAQYDAGTAIAEVAISSCSSITAEPFVESLDPVSLANLHAAGYTDALIMAALLNAPDDYAAWKNTPLDYTFNTFRDSDTGQLVENSAFTIQVMQAFRGALGARSVVANHGLQSPLSAGAEPVYAEFTSLYEQAQPQISALEFQTYGPTVDWPSAIALGLTYHPTEIEIWDTVAAGGSAPLSQAQLASWAAQLR